MRFRTFLFVSLAIFFALPIATHAQGIPFFGPIIPEAQNVCAASWGLLMIVINRIIALLLTLAIVFVAPLTIAYAGFLYVVNPVNPNGIAKAKTILRNTIVGIVIALAGWMIVDALMAVLYNKGAPGLSGKTWNELITGDTNKLCIPLQSSLQQAGQTGIPEPGISVVPGTCSIQPLTPLTDPLAQQMEGGKTVIWDNTDPRLQSCVNKFISKVGGNVTSAYRPQTYQTHLWEIRDRWCTQGLQSSSDTACSSLKSTISTEVAKHFGSGWSCGAVGATSLHTSGTGVDISGINQSSTVVQQAASASCLAWANYAGDPYHYNLVSGCSCQ